MYFRIASEPSMDCGLPVIAESYSALDSALLLGRRIDYGSVEEPVPFSIQPNPRYPLAMDAYYSECHLMSRRMADVLQSAGVCNLQFFGARVENTVTAEVYSDYLVANIVGMVSCADPAASQGWALADKLHFRSLAIDKARAAGLMVFRLAESMTDVIVHEQVADRLRAARLKNLMLEPT